jgi:hypothetical protein
VRPYGNPSISYWQMAAAPRADYFVLGHASREGPKVCKLFAGENWIRNFSSAVPSVASQVYEMRDPGTELDSKFQFRQSCRKGW